MPDFRCEALNDSEGFFNKNIMRAKATQFHDHIFRSRIEAYIYQYIRLKYRPETIEYEPEHFSTEFYVPDFIVSNEMVVYAVEVKPMLEKANWVKYMRWMQEFTCIEFIVVITPKEMQIMDRHKFTFKDKVDQLFYFQAVNDVKHKLNTVI